MISRTDEDELVETQGMEVIVKPDHMLYLDGVVIDYPTVWMHAALPSKTQMPVKRADVDLHLPFSPIFFH
ncbi:hypothetical protein [Rhodohalobacter sp.]|uniref:hypothetical protein n=1 Tax=Rhodohalobacter sp. TaxID=1974210 RepID=UPI002ACE2223|nr:hypothetical protein [Rhodohalobacter sp.]